MCTISLITRQNGYALAMNRDEQLTRVPGLPPAPKIINGSRVLSPSEPGGGTWIALNVRGVTFALINWYATVSYTHLDVYKRQDVTGLVSRSSLLPFFC